jgi:FKBP-type peptidyl-prolyl cis-trans isomerase 2
MKVGQTKTITIPAKEAYGEWSEKNIITVPMDQLPKGDYQKGMKLSTSYGQVLVVHEVLSTGVVLDGNHELA